VKPLDSNDGALVATTSEPDESSNARRVPFVTDSADAEVPTPRARSEVVAASAASASAGARISRVVPWGTTDDDAGDDFDAPPLAPITARPSVAVLAATADASPVPTRAQVSASVPALRHSDVVPRDPRAPNPNESSPSPPEARAARIAEFVATRIGPGFEDDDDDEATTVDAGAALTADEREALGRRVHSVMGETQPVGTPSPGPVQALDEDFAEAARDRRNAFKQTILLGLPKLESPAPPATATASTAASPAASPVDRVLIAPVSAAEEPVALVWSEHAVAEEASGEHASAEQASSPPAPETTGSTEPALMASVVRVVGPPTQPPPRRSRRIAGIASPEPSEPDHEAFVLTNAITPDLSRRSAVPAAPPRGPRVDATVSRSSNRFAMEASQASLPGVMLPPAPAHPELEPESFPSTVPPAPLLRATIEPPMSSLARTRPPLSQRTIASDPALGELPVADPFAGFVAPAPSAAQRWLVVVVVALAVVGLCSLAAIALGLLGKTGW
jgi:hypothetical protein